MFLQIFGGVSDEAEICAAWQANQAEEKRALCRPTYGLGQP